MYSQNVECLVVVVFCIKLIISEFALFINKLHIIIFLASTKLIIFSYKLSQGQLNCLWRLVSPRVCGPNLSSWPIDPRRCNPITPDVVCGYFFDGVARSRAWMWLVGPVFSWGGLVFFSTCIIIMCSIWMLGCMSLLCTLFGARNPQIPFHFKFVWSSRWIWALLSIENVRINYYDFSCIIVLPDLIIMHSAAPCRDSSCCSKHPVLFQCTSSAEVNTNASLHGDVRSSDVICAEAEKKRERGRGFISSNAPSIQKRAVSINSK